MWTCVCVLSCLCLLIDDRVIISSWCLYWPTYSTVLSSTVQRSTDRLYSSRYNVALRVALSAAVRPWRHDGGGGQHPKVSGNFLFVRKFCSIDKKNRGLKIPDFGEKLEAKLKISSTHVQSRVLLCQRIAAACRRIIATCCLSRLFPTDGAATVWWSYQLLSMW